MSPVFTRQLITASKFGHSFTGLIQRSRHLSATVSESHQAIAQQDNDVKQLKPSKKKKLSAPTKDLNYSKKHVIEFYSRMGSPVPEIVHPNQSIKCELRCPEVNYKSLHLPALTFQGEGSFKKFARANAYDKAASHLRSQHLLPPELTTTTTQPHHTDDRHHPASSPSSPSPSPSSSHDVIMGPWRLSQQCTHCTPTQPCELCSYTTWRNMELREQPPLDWQAIFASDHRDSRAPVPSHEVITLPGGLELVVVTHTKQVEHWLFWLREDLEDPLVAIDTEWCALQPAAPVALLQLATARRCLLLRTCSMKFRLPQALVDFLQDPNIVLLAASWEGADEHKMQRSFKFGMDNYRRILDCQRILRAMGYVRVSVAHMAQLTLHSSFRKQREVQMSNWETPALRWEQAKYAALDVLTVNHGFRALRRWHLAAPHQRQLCASCSNDLGAAWTPAPLYVCHAHGCDSNVFRSMQELLQHCNRTRHPMPLVQVTCACCQRQRYEKVMAQAGSEEGSSSSSSSSAVD